jgi:hypothetical protein
VRERAPGRARTRSGRVPWTLLAVLAATVLATLGLFGTWSSPTASAADVVETSTVTRLLSASAAPSAAPSAGTASPAGIERPAPVTDLSAPVTSADSDPSPAGSDQDPPSDGKALVALALFVLVLCGVGRGRCAADDALSGAYIGAVDHVPRDGLKGQFCPDALPPAAPATVRRARRVSSDVEAAWRRPKPSTVRPSCRAVFSRVRAQVGDEAGGRGITNADREAACAGASPDSLPRAVSRSRSPVTSARGRQGVATRCRRVGRPGPTWTTIDPHPATAG